MGAARLFWSKRGEVACVDHAPARSSVAWREQGWAEVPAPRRWATRYQCQHCERTPLHHRRKPLRPDQPLVLNVEPRSATLNARARLLRQEGFSVANATTVEDALDKARQARPSLVLLGSTLFGEGASSACGRLKSDAALAYVPLVLIGSTLDSLNRVALRSDGAADGFILEPAIGRAIGSTLWSYVVTGA
jgi:CheY-like chemotaxis protein